VPCQPPSRNVVLHVRDCILCAAACRDRIDVEIDSGGAATCAPVACGSHGGTRITSIEPVSVCQNWAQHPRAQGDPSSSVLRDLPGAPAASSRRSPGPPRSPSSRRPQFRASANVRRSPSVRAQPESPCHSDASRGRHGGNPYGPPDVDAVSRPSARSTPNTLHLMALRLGARARRRRDAACRHSEFENRCVGGGAGVVLIYPA
jgi:hypothetical protein